MESLGVSGIIKQGWVEKRSRFLKEWRKRWMVLAGDIVMTFKTDNTNDSATENFSLRQCSIVKSADEDVKKPNAFRVETYNRTLFFCTVSAVEKEAWIGAIGRAMMRPSVMLSKGEEDALDGN